MYPMLRSILSAGGLFVCALLLCTGRASAQPYLSDLSATRDDPLYATYAAPLHRSAFVIDEGYRFRFYEDDESVGFDTDHGGRIALAFRRGGEVRYLLKEMHRAPTVTTSYSDLVRYHYEPFPGIRVEAFFQVYSSTLAILDVQVTNDTGAPVELDVYPLLHHDGGLTEAAISEDGRAFSFEHLERPDGWTTGHGVPHVTERRDVFLLGDVPDAFGAYSLLRGYEAANKTDRSGARENYAVEWGLVRHADGSLCTHTPPAAQQVIWLGEAPQEILTEQAPKWGDPDPNIPGNGYQGAELGNFERPAITPGDTFTVAFTCLATGQRGVARGVVPPLPAPGGIHTEVALAETPYPPVPENVEATLSQDGQTVAVSWAARAGYRYDLYRRGGDPPGRYDRIAAGLTTGGYLDGGLDAGVDYGYVVLARDSAGTVGPHAREVGRFTTPPFFDDLANERLAGRLPSGTAQVVAFQRSFSLAPGATDGFRLVRGVDAATRDAAALRADAEALLAYDMTQAVRDDEALYSRIPDLAFNDPGRKLTYWSAFNLMRQVMLPPEGASSYNYYVFSREPTWGWGHGGQVFHESLTMLAYVLMDPESAMNSQRVYFERQHDDGYINYRTGAYLDETIPTDGSLTTSAPWLSWENWELYRITEDEAFLREAYAAGDAFYRWWLRNRDRDGDGLAEWGGHAVLESVRDGQVAVWDHVGWPTNFEALDLNVMLVREARALARMAEVLGDTLAARQWTAEADTRTERVNETFWDDETGFFYHVDRRDHDFTYRSANDLKRKEIIGFLPLWAGTATPAQAERLVAHLTDPEAFWRPYGVPTLAADDPYYNPMGYWNGPVWVPWQYLVFRGLRDYGYADAAATLADRVLSTVTHHLSTTHTFWELYSPDDLRAGHHQAYIWTGLVARMAYDLAQTSTSTPRPKPGPTGTLELDSHPNPFRDAVTLAFHLPAPGPVRLSVYDALGRRVAVLADGWHPAGPHRVTWTTDGSHGTAPASGLYLVRLEGPGIHRTLNLLRLR